MGPPRRDPLIGGVAGGLAGRGGAVAVGVFIGVPYWRVDGVGFIDRAIAIVVEAIAGLGRAGVNVGVSVGAVLVGGVAVLVPIEGDIRVRSGDLLGCAGQR